MGIKNYFGKKKEGAVETVQKTVGVQHIKENWDYFYGLGKGVFEIKKNKSEKSEENLTFDQVVDKYKLTTAQLQRQYKFKMIEFYLFITVFVLVFFYMCFSIGKMNIFTAISCVPFLMVSMMMAVDRSLTCFRYKYKSFKTFQEWKESFEYFPATWVDLTKTYKTKRQIRLENSGM